jgi:sodium-dependent phosphate cotransporter
LRRAAETLSGVLQGAGGFDYESPFAEVLSAAVAPVEFIVARVFGMTQFQGVAIILVSAAIIFTALFSLVKVMRSLVRTRVEGLVTNALGSSAVLAILVGVAVTVMVQSSSITTSLLLPLGAAGLLRLEQALPITIGANIGTTVTALLAALAGSGVNAGFGLQIALVHFMFNLTGLVVIYPLKVTRNIPLRGARYLTTLALRSRRLTLLWVAILFYGVPALLLFVDRVMR